MIARALTRTALKWLAFVVAFIILVSVVNFGLSFVPFTPQWNGKRAVAKAEKLEGQIDTLTREATGNAEISQAVETLHTREIIIREGTAQAIAEARSAPDADTPLSDERASRLRAADDRLCLATGLCATHADAADSGSDEVPDSGPAG